MISDMGSFNLKGKEHELLKYETALPLRFDPIKYKGICIYHQADINGLSENKKQLLFKHHLTKLIITETK